MPEAWCLPTSISDDGPGKEDKLVTLVGACYFISPGSPSKRFPFLTPILVSCKFTRNITAGPELDSLLD